LFAQHPNGLSSGSKTSNLPLASTASKVNLRETREGWILPTVETEVNWDSKSTNERGPSLVGSLGLSCRYKRFLFCLGCSSRPITKLFFPNPKLFQCLCPICTASWAGSRAGSPFSEYLSLVNLVTIFQLFSSDRDHFY
jgi:hypothetical protein